VSLYVAHFNLCRVHETLRTTPAIAIGVADRVWSIGALLDGALATQPIDPLISPPDRRRRFRVIEGRALLNRNKARSRMVAKLGPVRY
jgi:hypothetical protein